MSAVDVTIMRTTPERIPGGGTTPRVLMADDDHDEHLLLLMAAEEARVQLEFQFVDDGSDLVAHLAQIQRAEALPSLILLDLRMPILDGHRALRQLKTDPVFWRIPTIVFTTSTSESDKRKAIEGGAADVVVKPGDFQSMIAFARDLSHFCAIHAVDPAITDEDLAAMTDGDDSEYDLDGLNDLSIDFPKTWRI